MNDQLWAIKVVIENVRKFICVMQTKFLCLGNFHFRHNQVSHSTYPEYILLLSGTISEEALIVPYFGIVN